MFRYMGDVEDKAWMAQAGHVPNGGVKAFLMLASQVRQVAECEGLRPPVPDFPEFRIPDWLFRKVRFSFY